MKIKGKYILKFLDPYEHGWKFLSQCEAVTGMSFELLVERFTHLGGIDVILENGNKETITDADMLKQEVTHIRNER